VIDEKLQGELRITVIATGFTGEAQPLHHPCAGGVQAATSNTNTTTPPPPVEPKDKAGLDIPEFLQRRRPRN